MRGIGRGGNREHAHHRAGAGDDLIEIGDLSFLSIDGGSGDDTLGLDGALLDLDLTGLGSSVIEGIERIDLTGSGNNSLTLEINDLLQLSDETNELFVAGSADSDRPASFPRQQCRQEMMRPRCGAAGKPPA